MDHVVPFSDIWRNLNFNKANVAYLKNFFTRMLRICSSFYNIFPDFLWFFENLNSVNNKPSDFWIRFRPIPNPPVLLTLVGTRVRSRSRAVFQVVFVWVLWYYTQKMDFLLWSTSLNEYLTSFALTKLDKKNTFPRKLHNWPLKARCE
jgi:hypothetical protein